MSDQTRREDPHPAVTRGAESATRLESSARGVGDSSAVGAGFHLVNLPPALAADYVVDEDATAALDSPGGQANVVVARARADGRLVVVKIYKRGTELDEAALAGLVEMGADPRGRDHVVPILSHGRSAGLVWEVQEHMAFGSLARLYRDQSPLRPGVALDLARELARALAYLHRRGVVHRDLKPANVFLRALEPLDAVLGDFGLATRMALTVDVMSVAGSWPYLPPESRGNVVSPAMDWWALGVILAEGLTGRHLFQDPSGTRMLPDAQIANQLYERTYVVPTSGDERWDRLLRGLLTHDYEHRWGAAEVEAWLAGGAPDVYVEPSDDAGRRTVAQPFAFAGSTFTQPAALAAALKDRWPEARELVVGRRADELRMWLRQTSVGDAAEHVLTGGVGSAEPVAVRLQLILDPSIVPAFRGRELSSASLSGVVDAARHGDREASSWICDLRTERVLSAWSSEAVVPEPVRLADDSLDAAWQGVDATLAAAPPDLASEVRAGLEPILLAAALDPAQAREVVARGRDVAARSRGTLPAWAEQLRAAARADDADVARHALAAVVLPAVEATERARAAAERDARALELHAQRVARRREWRRAGGARFRHSFVGGAALLAVPAALVGAALHAATDRGVGRIAWTVAAVAVATAGVCALWHLVLPATVARIGRTLFVAALVLGLRHVALELDTAGRLVPARAWWALPIAVVAGAWLARVVDLALDVRFGDRVPPTPRPARWLHGPALALGLVAVGAALARLYDDLASRVPLGVRPVDGLLDSGPGFFRQWVEHAWATIGPTVGRLPGELLGIVTWSAAILGCAVLLGDSDLARIGPRLRCGVLVATAVLGLAALGINLVALAGTFVGFGYVVVGVAVAAAVVALVVALLSAA